MASLRKNSHAIEKVHGCQKSKVSKVYAPVSLPCIPWILALDPDRDRGCDRDRDHDCDCITMAPVHD